MSDRFLIGEQSMQISIAIKIKIFRWLRQNYVELAIKYKFPEQIGRIRIVDWLIEKEESYGRNK